MKMNCLIILLTAVCTAFTCYALDFEITLSDAEREAGIKVISAAYDAGLLDIKDVRINTSMTNAPSNYARVPLSISTRKEIEDKIKLAKVEARESSKVTSTMTWNHREADLKKQLKFAVTKSEALLTILELGKIIKAAQHKNAPSITIDVSRRDEHSKRVLFLKKLGLLKRPSPVIIVYSEGLSATGS